MTLALRPRAGLIAIFLLGDGFPIRPPVPGVGVIVTAAPIYLAPDTTRVPLTTLPTGTQMRGLTSEGDWNQFIYRDRYLGDRTGDARAVNVRIEAAAPPSAAPAPAVPGQVAPSTPAQHHLRPRRSPPPEPDRRDRAYVWLSGLVQPESTAFASALTFTQYNNAPSRRTTTA